MSSYTQQKIPAQGGADNEAPAAAPAAAASNADVQTQVEALETAQEENGGILGWLGSLGQSLLGGGQDEVEGSGGTDVTAASGGTDVAGSGGGDGGKVEYTENQQQMVDLATEFLSTGWLDWGVSGLEGMLATSLLSALPPEAQGRAISELDDDQFEALLTSTPLEDRASFESLYKNTTDPERRLKLWAEYHRATASNARDAAKEDVSFGDWFAFWDDSEEEFRNERRDTIVDSANQEIDEEVAFLMERMNKGEAVTIEEIDQLAARKAKELEIEMEYGINFTNNTGWEAQGSKPELQRRVWALEELQNVEDALGRIPGEHVKYSHGLSEIERIHTKIVQKSDGTWLQKDGVGGDASNGKIRVMDTGADLTASPWRTDADSAYAGHDTDQLSLLEEVITHEIGHTVEAANPDVATDWRSASTWESWTDASLKAQLMADGMTEADADQFLVDIQGGLQQHGGKSYRKNKYGNIVSFDSGAHAVHDPNGDVEFGQDDSSEWSYASQSEGEHFAETYAKAVHAPEALREDLVTQPQQWVTDAQTAVDAANANLEALKAAGAPEAAVEQAEQTLKDAQDKLTEAVDTRDDRQKQWDIMRTDVFGLTDDKVTGASGELTAAGADPAVVAAFEAEAERVMTPYQLEQLKQRYLAGI